MSMTAYELGNCMVKDAGRLGDWLVRSGLVLGRKALPAPVLIKAPRPVLRQPQLAANQIPPSATQAAGGRYVFNRGAISPQFAQSMAPYLAGGQRKFKINELSQQMGISPVALRRQVQTEYMTGAGKQTPGQSSHRFEPTIQGQKVPAVVAKQPAPVAAKPPVSQSPEPMPPAPSASANPAAPVNEGPVAGFNPFMLNAMPGAQEQRKAACFYGYNLGKRASAGLRVPRWIGAPNVASVNA